MIVIGAHPRANQHTPPVLRGKAAASCCTDRSQSLPSAPSFKPEAQRRLVRSTEKTRHRDRDTGGSGDLALVILANHGSFGCLR
jgi:hypothetical protein